MRPMRRIRACRSAQQLTQLMFLHGFSHEYCAEASARWLMATINQGPANAIFISQSGSQFIIRASTLAQGLARSRPQASLRRHRRRRGGHGLATAYYLAKNHGIRKVAVIEKGWLGGGNTGRNTTLIRSNYLLAGNSRFYEWSMKLWETMSQELNYNVMFSQRGC